MSFSVLCIVGPTASGKSDLALELAGESAHHGLKLEVVNGDAMQLYAEMNIGTAKLTKSERSLVPHHLFDILSPSQEMTAVEFQRLARERFGEILSRGSTPLLVGGSMFYIAAAMDELEFAPTDPAVRLELELEADRHGPGALFARLETLDPATAAVIPRQNVRRVIRALEVIAITGEPYSNSLPEPRYHKPSLTIGIEVEREELKERIAVRVKRMWQQGLLDEARVLRERYDLSRTAKVAIGYAQAFSQLDGQMNESEAIEQTIQLTNRYARRQMSWFRRDHRTSWVPGNADILQTALQQIRLAK